MAADRELGKNNKIQISAEGEAGIHMTLLSLEKGQEPEKKSLPSYQVLRVCLRLRVNQNVTLPFLNTTHNKITVRHSSESWKMIVPGEQFRGMDQSQGLIRYWEEPSDILSSTQNTPNQNRLIQHTLCMCVCTHLCLTLCNRRDCSPPVSSVHGIFQARIHSVGLTKGRDCSSPDIRKTRMYVFIVPHNFSIIQQKTDLYRMAKNTVWREKAVMRMRLS